MYRMIRDDWLAARRRELGGADQDHGRLGASAVLVRLVHGEQRAGPVEHRPRRRPLELQLVGREDRADPDPRRHVVDTVTEAKPRIASVIGSSSTDSTPARRDSTTGPARPRAGAGRLELAAEKDEIRPRLLGQRQRRLAVLRAQPSNPSSERCRSRNPPVSGSGSAISRAQDIRRR